MNNFAWFQIFMIFFVLSAVLMMFIVTDYRAKIYAYDRMFSFMEYKASMEYGNITTTEEVFGDESWNRNFA